MQRALQEGLGDRYLVGQEIGRGGMGAVYRVRQLTTGLDRAVKVLLLAAEAPPERRALFLRETRSMDRLCHPRLVPLLEAGASGSLTYLITDYYEGGSVADLVRRRKGPLGVDEATSIALDALGAVAYLHGEGFVHRDIKPQNLLLDANGAAHVADLGLAKSFELAGLSGFTRSKGSAWGTVLFMAPEQLSDYKYVKPSADVFSVGVTLYWMLSGALPREGPQRGRSLLTAPMIPLRQRCPEVPGPLASVVDRALIRDARARYSCGAEMLAALQAAAEQL